MTLPAIGKAQPDDEDVPSVLTREQAATMLHVSPRYVDELVSLGRLSYITAAGTHGGQCGPQVLGTADVRAYREKSKRRQVKGLEKTVEASERLNLYDEEAGEVPARNFSGAPRVKPAAGGLKEATARGEQAKLDWTKDGTLLTPEAFAQRRQVPVEGLVDAEASGQLFSMHVDGRPYYLAELLKFAPADAATLCAALGTEDGASKMIFLLRRHGMLGGRTVAEAVDSGEMHEALNAAQAWRERR